MFLLQPKVSATRGNDLFLALWKIAFLFKTPSSVFLTQEMRTFRLLWNTVKRWTFPPREIVLFL